MRLNELTVSLEKIAPLHLAESWDNVGLLAGDPQQRVRRVMLTIDLTRAVLTEAQAAKTDVIVAYHPPIWEALKTVTAGQALAPLLYEVVRGGMALYSFHTALDVAAGGVNDMLAEVVGIADARPLKTAKLETGTLAKVVVFVPAEHAAAVSEAMFAAGAGHVGAAGKYSKCSFRSEGTGTFLCGEASKPAIGRPGSFEQVAEVKLETVAPMKALHEVIGAMVAAHPYEEVAYDVYPMVTGAVGYGLGRWGELAKPTTVNALIERIKQQLKVKTVGVIGPRRGKVRRAAVGAGSCGKMLFDVIKNECDFYLTGELSHHDALKLQEAGVTTVCVSHSNSERMILGRIARRLRREHGNLTVAVSRKDRDPFQWG